MDRISSKDLIDILDKKGISGDSVVNSLINSGILTYADISDFHIQKQFNQNQNVDHILVPISIFTLTFSPLESISKFLSEKYSMKNSEIAKILSKNPSAISLALNSCGNKKFVYDNSSLKIPLKEFQINSELSILEIVANFLKKNNLTLTEIGKHLGRDPRTIWTLCNRAKEKQGDSK